MNRIGLVDVDGHHYPNLVLMKLSAWHKKQGDTVEWADPGRAYDKVYKSKIFSWTKDNTPDYDCDTEYGGTGYGDYSKVLPDEIEHTCPDYSLYSIEDTAYGFTTRGCIRGCSFCIVPKKEGKIRPHAEIEEFLDGKKHLILMDNNIVAHEHGIRQLEKCREHKIAVDCNQGMDARIISKSDYLIRLLAELRVHNRYVRIACDNASEIEPCRTVIDKVLEINPKRRFIVYTLLTDDVEDSIHRGLLWQKYGHNVMVYAPPYRDFTNPEQQIPRWQKYFANWANNKFEYYKAPFSEFIRTKMSDAEITEEYRGVV